MRVVLDNNVFISGIFWRGIPNEIIKLAEEGKIEIFSTIEILTELFGVLEREKFKPFFEEAKTSQVEVSAKILELVKLCAPKRSPRVIKEDPPDNNFLACAITCQASFVISGDKHLLALKEFEGIPIVSPKEFLRIISQENR